MEINNRCVDCVHCVYRNRWMCDLTRWEFALWSGSCDEYRNKDDEE